MMDSKKFQIYGDESNCNGVVTYAFIVVPTICLTNIENIISKIKQEYGVETTEKIHTNILMHGDKRAKSAFKHLTKLDIFEMLNKLSVSIAIAGARGWVGYLHLKQSPDILLFESVGVGKNNVTSWDIRDIKLKMLFAYQAAIAPLTHMIPYEHVDAWLDSDLTKVLHLDANNRKINLLRSFFPIEHSDKKFFPNISHVNKPVLLEIADVLAYSSAKVLSKTINQDKTYFQSIVKSLNICYSKVHFLPISGPMMSAEVIGNEEDFKRYIATYL